MIVFRGAGDCHSQRGGYFLLLFVCDAVEKGKRKSTLRDVFGNRQTRCAAVAAPGGLQMNRREVAACGNTRLGKLNLNTVAVCPLG